jgi:hypothetical protein
VQWVKDDAYSEWLEDANLVGCDRLITDYFKRKNSSMFEEVEEREVSSNRRSTRSGKSKKEVKVRPEVKWNMAGKSKKTEKKKKNLSKETPFDAKKQKYGTYEKQFLTEKIQGLTSYIQSSKEEEQFDYLRTFCTNIVDFVEGVFLKDKLAYCGVKTMPPVRTFTVALPNMEKHFPKTLRSYYEYVLEIMKNKNDDAESDLPASSRSDQIDEEESSKQPSDNENNKDADE